MVPDFPAPKREAWSFHGRMPEELVHEDANAFFDKYLVV